MGVKNGPADKFEKVWCGTSHIDVLHWGRILCLKKQKFQITKFGEESHFRDRKQMVKAIKKRMVKDNNQNHPITITIWIVLQSK